MLTLKFNMHLAAGSDEVNALLRLLLLIITIMQGQGKVKQPNNIVEVKEPENLKETSFSCLQNDDSAKVVNRKSKKTGALCLYLPWVRARPRPQSTAAGIPTPGDLH